ncbi:MAG: LamG domain-containing protein, partial [bacterium]
MRTSVRFIFKKGFTLLEVLLVVGAIAIISSIVIIAINPSKQLAEARNAQRETDVKAILDALYQYSIDNHGQFPSGLDSQLRMIGPATTGCAINCGTGEIADGISISDTTQAQFAAGTYNLTQWNVGNTWVELTAAGRTARAGTYTSIVKDAGVLSAWSSLSWTPEFPYQKEFTNNRQSEVGYNQGNANMSGNILLLHMNDAISGAGKTIADTSSTDNHGTTAGATDCTVTGLLNTGCSFNGTNAYIQENTLINDVSGNNFTILTWVKTDIIAGQQSYIAFNTVAGGDRVILGHPAGSNILQLYDTAWRTTGRVVANGNWHQIGFIFNDTGNQIQVIYDGAIVLTRAFASSIAANDTFSIGMDYNAASPSNFYSGSMDELSTWNRVLTAAEILNFYRRGSLRLKFQVRSCNDAACSGETFVGPDGTATTSYTEVTNTGIGLPSVSLMNIIQNRYFQYRATFETDNTTYTPYLNDLTLGYLLPPTGGDISFTHSIQADFGTTIPYAGNTTWNAANSDVRLSTLTTHAGTYDSIIKDAGIATTWNSFAWKSTTPYLKEFPNNTQSESGYSTGNANMTSNALLMHMNDGGTAPGRVIADSSGTSNTGVTTNPNLTFTYTTQIDFGTTIPYA